MSKSILHIDDEESIRQILAELLTESGYEVRSAASPTEALAAAKLKAPDLIISDLQLNEADGLNTIAQLKEFLPGTPVILLTGVLIDPRVADATLGPLVSAYVEKTRPLSVVLEKIRQLLGTA